MAAPVSFSRWLAAAFAPLRKDIRIEHIGETQASILGIVKLVRQCVNAAPPRSSGGRATQPFAFLDPPADRRNQR